MVKITQYPRNADNTPMEILVGVITDITGNGGARLATPPVGPDGGPIETKGLMLVDNTGSLIDPSIPANIGLFTAANTKTVPTGVDFVQTSGHAAVGRGAARYVADASVTVINVGAYPKTMFIDATGRGFRLDHRQELEFYQFGAHADDAATDDWPTIEAVKAYFTWLADNGKTPYFDAYTLLYRPFPRLNVKIGHYRMSLPVNLDGGCWDINCEGVFPQNGSYGVVFTFDAGNDGIVIQSYNTTGVNGAKNSRANTYGAQGSRIRGLMVRSLGAGGFAAACGFYSRTRVILEDCGASKFPSHGVYITAIAGSGGATEGNANICHIVRGHFLLNGGCGIKFHGDDANGGSVIGANTAANGQYGIDDDSLLGNFISHCHSSSNGWDGAVGYVPTACTYLGNRYYVKMGQAAGASTNAPTGTTADNTWWGYIAAGGTYNGVVAWVNGTTFVEGGAYKAANANNTGSFAFCYTEGDQNPPQINAPCNVYGGNTALGNVGSANGLRWDSSGNLVIGPQYGARDCETYLNFSGSHHILHGRYYSAPGVAVEVGSVGFYYGFGNIYDIGNAGWLHRFRVNGVGVVNISNVGVDLLAGMVLSVAGTQVVTARQTGWAADTGTAKKTATASYAPGANLTYSAAYVQAEQTATSTRLQLIEPALRDVTQEMKALKDALIAHGLIGA